MKIIVTQEDIEKGAPEDSTFCPIALAVKRRFSEFGQVTEVEVKYETFKVAVNKQNIYYSLPRTAQKFIRDFDCLDEIEGPVKPFEFIARR